jgi:RimJ/RimL family protein N-acetyltransferase
LRFGLVSAVPKHLATHGLDVRLNRHTSNGYATEGARAAMEFAFASLQLPEVVSFTAPENLRSRRVMEKIGMIRDERGDFDHPQMPEGHRLRRHVLYRKTLSIGTCSAPPRG